MELLAPGQHIHLANSSVLSQRLSSPGCDVLSGTNRAGTVWGVGGEGSQGKWLWGNPPPEKRCLGCWHLPGPGALVSFTESETVSRNMALPQQMGAL